MRDECLEEPATPRPTTSHQPAVCGMVRSTVVPWWAAPLASCNIDQSLAGWRMPGAIRHRLGLHITGLEGPGPRPVICDKRARAPADATMATQLRCGGSRLNGGQGVQGQQNGGRLVVWPCTGSRGRGPCLRVWDDGRWWNECGGVVLLRA